MNWFPQLCNVRTANPSPRRRKQAVVEQTLPKFRIAFQDPSANKIVVDNADLKGQDFSIPGATNTIESC